MLQEYTAARTNSDDEQAVDTLIAISVVSKVLAEKIRKRMQKEKEEHPYGKDERTCRCTR